MRGESKDKAPLGAASGCCRLRQMLLLLSTSLPAHLCRNVQQKHFKKGGGKKAEHSSVLSSELSSKPCSLRDQGIQGTLFIHAKVFFFFFLGALSSRTRSILLCLEQDADVNNFFSIQCFYTHTYIKGTAQTVLHSSVQNPSFHSCPSANHLQSWGLVLIYP